MAVQNYVLLERIELKAAVASVTFSNIPQTGYTDLKIVVSGRATTNTGLTYADVRFNNDTTTSYTWRRLIGSGSAASSTSGANTGSLNAVGTLEGAGYTANTFANTEFYIPNAFSTTTAKSISVDGVSENNAAEAYAVLGAGLWSPGTQAAINRIDLIADGSDTFVSGSTFSLYGIANSSTTPTKAPKASGGNVIATDGTYWYHAFLSNGTFTPQLAFSCDVLTVAGGGPSSYRFSGGGGAGGVVYSSGTSLTSGSAYTVTIGAGGSGADGGTAPSGNGSNSQFGGLTAAVGGGVGGGTNYNSGVALGGGSGGGGTGGALGGTLSPGGSATSGQGTAGGTGGYRRCGGGGGGAGGVGEAAGPGSGAGNGYGGNGGVGVSTYSSWGLATNTGQNVSGTVYFAGGGGGGCNLGNAGDPAYTSGHSLGGNGGGGNGGAGNNGGASQNLVTQTSGTANTGGGGGGNEQSGTVAQGNGGSGIVIVRYLVA